MGMGIDCSDLEDIAFTINYYYELFIKSFPDNKNTEECIKFVIKMIMQDSRGHLNPSFVEQMVRQHRYPLTTNGFMVQCC